MKYDLYFEKHGEGWNMERLDHWKNESVVPRAGDQVFLKKIGWKVVESVGFSAIEKGKRIVLIHIK